ncbi:hypothetical protein M0805_008654 [Coniferiporia weirii]|nr:hypothetical protein M0805_008654 [Coniferiporia weirii]
MPWPTKVVRQFQAIPPNPDASEFIGAYNKLLYTLFPPDTDFAVVPRRLGPAPSRLESDSSYTISFEVLFEDRPVFILQLEKPTEIKVNSSRRLADEQIRRRMTDLAGECPIQTLHAVSAMGTRLCFYHIDTTDVDKVTDTAPAERWDCDILDEEGEARLRAVVREITGACTNGSGSDDSDVLNA